MNILVLNCGSSSIKFSLFATFERTAPSDGRPVPRTVFEGELDGIGTPQPKLKLESNESSAAGSRDMVQQAQTQEEAISTVLDAIQSARNEVPDAVGYRVVHPGAKLRGHQRLTPTVLDELEQAAVFAPLHDPEAVKLIQATMWRYPSIPHYVCFDTVFHETMPEEATIYPLPVEYREQGLRRYGFHGLSCESIVRQLSAEGELPKRMVIAHLGSGCSVTAVVEGRSVDTTMGMTPTGGVIMGTRSGDLDPGLVIYLLRQQQGSVEHGSAAVEALLNRESGMVGLTGKANDVQALRAAAGEGNSQAALALKVFTRSVTKATGGFAWLLGGLDAVVFSGGIGEHDEKTREEVLRGLESLGIEIDQSQQATEGIQCISTRHSRVKVFIVPAQEDLTIAMHVEEMFHSEK